MNIAKAKSLKLTTDNPTLLSNLIAEINEKARHSLQLDNALLKFAENGYNYVIVTQTRVETAGDGRFSMSLCLTPSMAIPQKGVGYVNLYDLSQLKETMKKHGLTSKDRDAIVQALVK